MTARQKKIQREQQYRYTCRYKLHIALQPTLQRDNVPLCCNNLFGQAVDLFVRTVVGLETFLRTKVGRAQTKLTAFGTSQVCFHCFVTSLRGTGLLRCIGHFNAARVLRN